MPAADSTVPLHPGRVLKRALLQEHEAGERQAETGGRQHHGDEADQDRAGLRRVRAGLGRSGPSARCGAFKTASPGERDDGSARGHRARFVGRDGAWESPAGAGAGPSGLRRGELDRRPGGTQAGSIRPNPRSSPGRIARVTS